MDTGIAIPDPMDSPLSAASLRYLVRHPAPGGRNARPFGLRNAEVVETPRRPRYRYCPEQQVAVDDEGRPLIETLGKDWKTKSSTDGDEGPEENWGWEEA